MSDCHREWQTADGNAEQYLADSIQRDLDEVRRICQALRTEVYGDEVSAARAA